MAVSGTNLYIGGKFTTAGGVSANNIARWDGASWVPLGSGMTQFSVWWVPCVNALATDEGGHLFVGGRFYYAGTNLSPYIAQANIAPQAIRIDRIRVAGGMVILDCCGWSGNACSVQRASDVRFTQNVTTLLTTNAPAGGVFCHTDSAPPSGTAFYRLVMP